MHCTATAVRQASNPTEFSSKMYVLSNVHYLQTCTRERATRTNTYISPVKSMCAHKHTHAIPNSIFPINCGVPVWHKYITYSRKTAKCDSQRAEPAHADRTFALQLSFRFQINLLGHTRRKFFRESAATRLRISGGVPSRFAATAAGPGFNKMQISFCWRSHAATD